MSDTKLYVMVGEEQVAVISCHASSVNSWKRLLTKKYGKGIRFIIIPL